MWQTVAHVAYRCARIKARLTIMRVRLYSTTSDYAAAVGWNAYNVQTMQN